MPRTKRARATSNSTERYSAVKTFERHVQLRIAKMERDAQAALKSFNAFVDVTVSRLPMEIRQMTLGELMNWQECDSQKENSPVKDHHMQPPAVPRPRKTNKAAKRATTAASDDGYVTEGTSVGSTSRTTKTQTLTPASTVRTRSFTRASRAKLSEINEKTVTAKPKNKDRRNVSLQNKLFQTPMMQPLGNVYSVVTPKVKPNTPLNVLRRPRQGEMVLSMQGSPLLVSAVIEERTANINVPLANGNVMSLLPQEGLRMSNIPSLDSETKHQLRTLKNHLEKVISFKK